MSPEDFDEVSRMVSPAEIDTVVWCFFGGFFGQGGGGEGEESGGGHGICF